VPALYNFQYGQFHLPTVVLAVGGMLAFEHRRHALGGALLGFAMLSKIFPGVLVIPLLMQRRYRAVAWTAGFTVLYTLAALLAFGTAPFAAFFDYHLPRLSSGAAFAFESVWPNAAVPLIAANLSPCGLVGKLETLGVPGTGPGMVALFNWVVTAVVIAAAVVAGRRGRRAGVHAVNRLRHAQLWLALLALASMRSPGAFGDYLPVTSLWLLTTVAPRMKGRPFWSLPLIAAWVLLFLLPGVVPLPELPEPRAAMLLSMCSMVAMAALSIWTIAGRSLAPAAVKRGRPNRGFGDLSRRPCPS
jgi:hypothetical protein